MTFVEQLLLLNFRDHLEVENIICTVISSGLFYLVKLDSILKYCCWSFVLINLPISYGSPLLQIGELYFIFPQPKFTLYKRLLFLLAPIRGHSQTLAFFKSTVLCCSYVSYFSPVTLSNKSGLLLLTLTFVLILVSTHFCFHFYLCLEFC